MKKFVIRSIGWIFDDDWYNFDKEHDIVGVYTSKDIAIQKKRSLDCIYFKNHFSFLGRYQTKYNHTETNINFIDVQKIAIYLSEELHIPKGEIIDKYNRLKDNSNILSRINEYYVAEILKFTNLIFFKIIEFNSEDIFFYHTRKNPKVWESQFDKYYYANNPDYFYYYFDDSYDHKKRLSNTIKDCYEVAITTPENSISWQLASNSPLKGELTSLSRTPSILASIIQQSKNISYDSDKKIILFKKELLPEELMTLDSVLIHPTIITEKVYLKSLRDEEKI